VRKTQRGWRRVLIWLVASVVLGAATTVGVAWAECLREPPSLAVYVMHGGWVAPPALETITAYNWPQGPPAGITPREDSVHYITAFGWPRKAMLRRVEWSFLLQLSPSWHGVTGYRVIDGFETPFTIGRLVTPDGTQRLHRVLPAQPMWPAFRYNTTVFAAGWFALFALLAVPGAIRRRRRARLGLCPGCGYDLRHSVGVCPECGRAIDATAAAATAAAAATVASSKEGATCRSADSSSPS